MTVCASLSSVVGSGRMPGVEESGRIVLKSCGGSTGIVTRIALRNQKGRSRGLQSPQDMLFGRCNCARGACSRHRSVCDKAIEALFNGLINADAGFPAQFAASLGEISNSLLDVRFHHRKGFEFQWPG